MTGRWREDSGARGGRVAGRGTDPAPGPGPGRAAGVGALALAALAAAAVAVTLRADVQEPFPHEEHAGLFPLCAGCHEGVPTGDRAAFYPQPQLCAGCHDGVELDSVRWTPPAADEPKPFAFTHPGHAAELAREGEPALACEECHTPAGAPRMAVAGEQVLARCFACHGHPAESHYVDADCETCHPPAGENGLRMGAGWLAGLPYPADHVTGEFLPERHGQLAAAEPGRCATCHTRERCATCHVDAADRPEIAGIPAAPPSLRLPRFAAHYTIPPSHLAPDFIEAHAHLAATSRTCATCHTREDCAACHAGDAPAPMARLASAAEVLAPGVLLERRLPPSHGVASFLVDHGALAAAAPTSCTTCHTRTMCSDCHQAAAVTVAMPTALAGPRFHPDNYMARHSAEAYGRRLECASCHDVAAFCRDCHAQTGFQASGRLGPGFHDAEPIWLLRHGQAARQGLESCATCHQQRDCLQCHSTIGAFQVNPHGKSFDPARARARNPGICFACHVGDPGA
ncbi:MAG TPA: hypothetical protein VMM12_08555 [Longimicrobiales bacterium]|nr:hypothetical protein [Longimicrobiales bacterium]